MSSVFIRKRSKNYIGYWEYLDKETNKKKQKNKIKKKRNNKKNEKKNNRKKRN